MKILLDTHILLWALADDRRLPPKAKEIILREESEIYYSTVSVWEVSIKHSLHPEQMPISGQVLSGYCRKAGYRHYPSGMTMRGRWSRLFARQMLPGIMTHLTAC